MTPVALRFLLEGGLVSLFAAGICIILLGEVAMVMLSYEGPIISFLLRKEYSAFLKIWLVSIVVGVICEGANYFFPFWEWLPGEGYSWMLLETLIILFGYLVVIHPMIIFWQTIDDKGDEKKTKKS